jgi:hypothetical protein
LKRKSSVLVGLFLLALCSAQGYAGQAYNEKAVADFYRGKTLTIVGFDRYARAIARHLGKYVPAIRASWSTIWLARGRMISANYTYNQAPKDGTVINSFDGGLLPSQLYGSSAVQFDMRSSTIWRAGRIQVHHGGDEKVGNHQNGRFPDG